MARRNRAKATAPPASPRARRHEGVRGQDPPRGEQPQLSAALAGAAHAARHPAPAANFGAACNRPGALVRRRRSVGIRAQGRSRSSAGPCRRAARGRRRRECRKRRRAKLRAERRRPGGFRQGCGEYVSLGVHGSPHPVSTDRRSSRTGELCSSGQVRLCNAPQRRLRSRTCPVDGRRPRRPEADARERQLTRRRPLEPARATSRTTRELRRALTAASSSRGRACAIAHDGRRPDRLRRDPRARAATAGNA